jgi:1,4-dihydroxy-2-naphthoyl-CoA synthase
MSVMWNLNRLHDQLVVHTGPEPGDRRTVRPDELTPETIAEMLAYIADARMDLERTLINLTGRTRA